MLLAQPGSGFYVAEAPARALKAAVMSPGTDFTTCTDLGASPPAPVDPDSRNHDFVSPFPPHSLPGAETSRLVHAQPIGTELLCVQCAAPYSVATRCSGCPGTKPTGRTKSLGMRDLTLSVNHAGRSRTQRSWLSSTQCLTAARIAFHLRSFPKRI
jgi:hypothetical protein